MAERQQRHNVRSDVSAPLVPIEDLRPHPKNYNTGAVNKIAESLEVNGQYRPLVVQASGRVICAGNNTWAAAKKLGWTHIAADILNIDDTAALRILAVDNLSARTSEFDDQALADVLEELRRAEDGLAGTSWSDGDLDQLIATLEGPGGTHSADLFTGSEEDTYAEQYAVIVACTDEAHQRAIYERLRGDGLNVKVVST